MGVGDEATDSDDGYEHRIRLDVFHHWPEEGIPITLDGSLQVDLDGNVTVTIVEPTPPADTPVAIKLTPGTPRQND